MAAIIYPAVQLKRFKEELARRTKLRFPILSAIRAIPTRREAIMKSLAVLEADERFELEREVDNERQIRFLERTLKDSTAVSNANTKLEKMKKKLADMQREIRRMEA